MFTDLKVFQMAHAMARHAGVRQAVAAQNIAHADTPGYRVRAVKPFSAQMAGPEGVMRNTRAGHHGQIAPQQADISIVSTGIGKDPNQNSVSLDLELLNGVEARRQHDRALAIYKSSLHVLRASIGKG